MIREVRQPRRTSSSEHDSRGRLLCFVKWMTLGALLGALIYVQIKPRFLLFRYTHYGWPFVHLVRHVEIRFREPAEVYYVTFLPGLIGDVLSWTILIGCTAMVLKPCERGPGKGPQIRLSTLLWLITVAAVTLAIYRAEPRDFWVCNSILHVEPRMIQGALFFGLSSTIYVALRSLARLSWNAVAPYVAR